MQNILQITVCCSVSGLLRVFIYLKMQQLWKDGIDAISESPTLWQNTSSLSALSCTGSFPRITFRRWNSGTEDNVTNVLKYFGFNPHDTIRTFSFIIVRLKIFYNNVGIFYTILKKVFY